MTAFAFTIVNSIRLSLLAIAFFCTIARQAVTVAENNNVSLFYFGARQRANDRFSVPDTFAEKLASEFENGGRFAFGLMIFSAAMIGISTLLILNVPLNSRKIAAASSAANALAILGFVISFAVTARNASQYNADIVDRAASSSLTPEEKKNAALMASYPFKIGPGSIAILTAIPLLFLSTLLIMSLFYFKWIRSRAIFTRLLCGDDENSPTAGDENAKEGGGGDGNNDREHLFKSIENNRASPDGGSGGDDKEAQLLAGVGGDRGGINKSNQQTESSERFLANYKQGCQLILAHYANPRRLAYQAILVSQCLSGALAIAGCAAAPRQVQLPNDFLLQNSNNNNINGAGAWDGNDSAFGFHDINRDDGGIDATADPLHGGSLILAWHFSKTSYDVTSAGISFIYNCEAVTGLLPVGGSFSLLGSIFAFFALVFSSLTMVLRAPTSSAVAVAEGYAFAKEMLSSLEVYQREKHSKHQRRLGGINDNNQREEDLAQQRRSRKSVVGNKKDSRVEDADMDDDDDHKHHQFNQTGGEGGRSQRSRSITLASNNGGKSVNGVEEGNGDDEDDEGYPSQFQDLNELPMPPHGDEEESFFDTPFYILPAALSGLSAASIAAATGVLIAISGVSSNASKCPKYAAPNGNGGLMNAGLTISPTIVLASIAVPASLLALVMTITVHRRALRLLYDQICETKQIGFDDYYRAYYQRLLLATMEERKERQRQQERRKREEEGEEGQREKETDCDKKPKNKKGSAVHPPALAGAVPVVLTPLSQALSPLSPASPSPSPATAATAARALPPPPLPIPISGAAAAMKVQSSPTKSNKPMRGLGSPSAAGGGSLLTSPKAVAATFGGTPLPSNTRLSGAGGINYFKRASAADFGDEEGEGEEKMKHNERQEKATATKNTTAGTGTNRATSTTNASAGFAL